MEDQVFQLTISAMTQHATIYSGERTEAKRSQLHGALRDALRDLTAPYETATVDPEHHSLNIKKLADRMSRSCKAILHEEHFRIGCAQKAFNLYLKYLWCLWGWAEPPHCPFDARVLQLIPGWRDEKWTKLDSLARYRKLVAAARKTAEAKGQSLAVWELNAYNETLEGNS